MQFGTCADLKEKLGNRILFGKDDCPFCFDLLSNDGILWKGESWAVIYNRYPYIFGAKHIMLIPIRHVRFSHESTSSEFGTLDQAYDFIKSFYGDEAYFSFTRESFSDRSVEHLHTHFISGELRRKNLVEMLKDQGFETRE